MWFVFEVPHGQSFASVWILIGPLDGDMDLCGGRVEWNGEVYSFPVELCVHERPRASVLSPLLSWGVAGSGEVVNPQRNPRFAGHVFGVPVADWWGRATAMIDG